MMIIMTMMMMQGAPGIKGPKGDRGDVGRRGEEGPMVRRHKPETVIIARCENIPPSGGTRVFAAGGKGPWCRPSNRQHPSLVH